MNKREAQDRARMLEVLASLGFDYDEAQSLRRISMTLHRWHELECGTGNGQTSYSVERETEEPDSQPYMRIQYPTPTGYVDRRYKIADRESGALKRLARIVKAKPALSYYVQTDPRGAALYILRPGDVPNGASADSYYNRGICVY